MSICTSSYSAFLATITSAVLGPSSPISCLWLQPVAVAWRGVLEQARWDPWLKNSPCFLRLQSRVLLNQQWSLFCTGSSKDHGTCCRECPGSMAGAGAGSASVWFSYRGARRSSPRCLHGKAVLVTRLGGIVCSGESVAHSSSADAGLWSHTRAGFLEQV